MRATANPAGATAANEEVVTKIYEFITNLQGSTLGVTGTIGLIVVAILLLVTIEDTFNDIWASRAGALGLPASCNIGPSFLWGRFCWCQPWRSNPGLILPRRSESWIRCRC